MSARTVRLLAVPLCASLGVLALTGVPSQGAAPAAGRTTVVQGGEGHADAARHKKKKKKKHHPKAIRNKHLGVPTPTAVSGPAANQASVTWPRTKGANRYSVLWSSGPYGKWPGPTTYVGPRWLPGSARSATLDVSGLGAYQLAPAYGNPVFMDLWADNSRDRAPRHKSKYVAAWPAISPSGGTHLRVGQYNVDGGNYTDDRGNRIAQNIASQSLSIVAIQESSTNGQAGAAARAIAAKLGWGGFVNDGDQGIIFNSSALSCGSLGVISGGAEGASCSFQGHRFTFVSAHFTGSNAATGAAAQALANAMPAGTAIVAGDFTSNREPYGSADQAQPVLVRNGYWDAQASAGRIGVQYSTYNGYRTEAANASGQGTRADYIMTRGIQGSWQYHNVANPGVGNPSDHNLVTSELALP